MNKRLFLYISLISSFCVLSFFIAIYPANFDFKEVNKAHKIARYIYFTPVAFILLFLIFTGVKISIKKKEFKLIPFLKEIGEFFLISYVPYILVRPVITGLLFIINVNLGPQKTIKVDGIVVYKRVRSSKWEDTQIHVEDKVKGIIEFTTFPIQAEEFWESKRFNMEMTSGSLGLIYKRKYP